VFKVKIDKNNVGSVKTHGSWLLSYGDMITLLITFFIMMISIRAGEISKVHAWVSEQLSNAVDELTETISQRGIEGLVIGHDSKGVRIVIHDKKMFDPGKADPNPELETHIKSIADAIRDLGILHLEKNPKLRSWIDEFVKNGLEWKVEIRVEGYTDNIPIIEGSDYRDNWELSAARAQVVMRMLQKFTRLPEAMFAVSGYGEYRPVRANTSTADRDLNRRVEIIINAALVKQQ